MEIPAHLPKTLTDEAEASWTRGTVNGESEIKAVNLQAKRVFELLEDNKSVIIKGPNGSGKSTTVIAVAHELESRNSRFGIFSIKEYFPSDPSAKAQADEFDGVLASLDHYRKAATESALLLVEAGDYSFTKVFFTDEGYRELKEKSGSLNQNQSAALRFYEQCVKFHELIRDPIFKVITTEHDQHRVEIIEPTLYREWQQTFNNTSTATLELG
jgi:DNA polymerase III delta prime subunit